MGANIKSIAGCDTSLTYTAASGLSTATDVSNLPYAPGTVISKSDGAMEKRYKLCLIEDAAVTVGQVVCYTTDDNGYEVTTDRAGGTSDTSLRGGSGLSR